MAEEDSKHKGGRPLLFKTVEELQSKIDAYFADCDPHPEQVIEYKYPQKTIKKNGKDVEVDDRSKRPTAKKVWRISLPKPYTITGLANFLGTSRETLINYQKRDEFFDTIKAAKDKCEHYWELQLLGAHATGPIFNLKNNYDWKDKTEQDIYNPDGSLSPVKQLSEAELRALAKKAQGK